MQKNSVEAEGPAADPDTADQEPAKSPPTKKERSDKNWRSARVIVAREKKVEIVFLLRDALAKSNVYLSKTVSKKRSRERNWRKKSMSMRRHHKLHQ